MKFKCNASGCEYTFESALDIASMLKSTDYTVVQENQTPAAPLPAVLAPKQ